MEAIAEKRVQAKPVVHEINHEHMTESLQRKAGIWLDAQVAASKHQISTQIVDLTPELAHVLLNRNPSNRKISDRVAATYARDIRNGAWLFNGEPVIVSREGLLNDGQHRCEAVIRAEAPIKVVLIIGVDRSTRTTLDQGKVRTVGDYLNMEGFVNSTQLAAAANYHWQYRTYGRLSNETRMKPTKSETMHEAYMYSGLENSVSVASKKGASLVGGIPFLAFCHFVFSQVNSGAADRFIDMMIYGEGLKKGDPILYVRNRIMMERGKRRVAVKSEMVFKAWNAFRRGEKVTYLKTVGGPLPKVEA